MRLRMASSPALESFPRGMVSPAWPSGRSAVSSDSTVAKGVIVERPIWTAQQPPGPSLIPSACRRKPVAHALVDGSRLLPRGTHRPTSAPVSARRSTRSGRRAAAGAPRAAHRLGQERRLLPRDPPPPRRAARADAARLAAAGPDAQPDRGRAAARGPGGDAQLDQPATTGPRSPSATAADEIDVLLVSPERFANAASGRVLDAGRRPRSGLLVIDEVHCISDWGHDFRPDYRRMARVLDNLPARCPVLGCTATANDRVVADVQRSSATDLVTLRGPLGRDGLQPPRARSAAPGRAARLAGDQLPEAAGHRHRLLPHRRATPTRRGLARSRASPPSPTRVTTDPEPARRRGSALLATRSRRSSPRPRSAWVSTSPTSPSSSTSRRPGRRSPTTSRSAGPAGACATSCGILLRGREDEDIQDWFIDTAFPSEEQRGR